MAAPRLSLRALSSLAARRLAAERLRGEVRRRDRRDQARQTRLGLDTFVADWDRLSPGTAVGPPLARTVWMLWLQGEAQAPELVRACIESWRRRNPGWRVRVLDAGSAAEAVTLPRIPSRISPNHLANIIRLRLLAAHGGVWTDATTFCMRPLDDWIDATQASGFFAFTRPQPLRSVANWFIAARPGAPLLEAWRAWGEAYILARRRPRSYFWQHHTFDWLLARDAVLRREWRDTPKVSARGPHVLQRLLDGHLPPAEQPSAEALASIPLFKISHKKRYTPSAIRRVFVDYGLEPPL